QLNPLRSALENRLLCHFVVIGHPRPVVGRLRPRSDLVDLVAAHYFALLAAVLSGDDADIRIRFAARLAEVDFVADYLAAVIFKIVILADLVSVDCGDIARPQSQLNDPLVIEDQLALDDTAAAILERDQVSASPVWLKPPLGQLEHRIEE